MTRAEVKRVLAVMQTVRVAIDNATSQREDLRLNDKYARLSARIAPYLEGRKPYTEESKAA